MKTLTPRQEDILRLVVEGKTNPEIAAELGLAVNSVASALYHLYARLNVTTRIQAARWYQRYLAAAA